MRDNYIEESTKKTIVKGVDEDINTNTTKPQISLSNYNKKPDIEGVAAKAARLINEEENRNSAKIPEHITWQDKKLKEDHEYLISRNRKLQKDHFNGKDSDEMKDVKDALKDLVAFLDEPLKLDDNPEMLQSQLIAATKRAAELYTNVISFSNVYISNKNPHGFFGYRRLHWVKKLKEKCINEQKFLDIAAGEMYEKIRQMDTYVSGADANDDSVSEIRNERKNLKNSSILYLARVYRPENELKTEEGGATSEVFEIKYDKNKTGFFKRGGRLMKVSEDSIHDEIGNVSQKLISSNKPENLAEAELIKNLEKSVINGFRDLKQVALTSTHPSKNEIKAIESMIISLEINILASDSFEEYRKRFEDGLEACKQRLKNYGINDGIMLANGLFFNKLKQDDATKSSLDKMFKKKHFKSLFAALVAQSNGVHDKADISLRNTATYRMADMMGLKKGSIVESRNCISVIDGKETRGIMLEKAKGEMLYDFVNNISGVPANRRFLTKDAVTQLMRIILLDQVCGQLDRGNSNIFVQSEKRKDAKGQTVYVITGFTGIDNDMSFGKIDEGFLENGTNRMNYMTYTELNHKSRPVISALNRPQSRFKKTATSLADSEALKAPEFKLAKVKTAQLKPLKLLRKTRLANLCIDRETYTNLMCLDMNEIRYNLADCDISDEEFAAMEKRLKYIKNAYRNRFAKYSGFVKQDYAEGARSIRDLVAIRKDRYSIWKDLQDSGFTKIIEK